MTEFISERTRVDHVEYQREYRWVSDPGSGYAFKCDEDGTLSLDALSKRERERLNLCIESVADEVMTIRVARIAWTYYEPAIIECERCGKHVALEGFTNTCECEADYDMSGNLLAPRSQWGEETGETTGDILRGGDYAED